MGSTVGKLLSRTSRSVKMYNIENRAHKVISEEKPKAAPKHKANLEEIERISKEYPDSYENLLKKDMQLDKHLKDVFVKSQTTIIDEGAPGRPLPLNRKPSPGPLYGYEEPEKFSPGKISLRLVLKLISEHQQDPKTNNPDKLALDYNLTAAAIRNVLKYFKVFEVYIPEDRGVKATFVGPSYPRMKSKIVEKKRLEAGNKSQKDS